MEHRFFQPIDFDRLKRCEIEPPFVPQIRDRDDTNGFDRFFTNQPIDSYQAESYPQGGDADFPDFSYHNAELRSADEGRMGHNDEQMMGTHLHTSVSS